MVSETKRFTVDAGHNLDQIESTFTYDGGKEITVGIGLGKHPKAKAATPASGDQADWISLWEDYAVNGELGTGLVLAPGELSGTAETPLDHLILAHATSGKPLVYYAGAGWTKSGQFTTAADWTAYLAAWAQRVASPLKITVSAQ
ncbi:MAG: DUF4861 family protein [Chthoniobacteraceae bacterium]